jgi:Domain of unknown function (DUF4164)
MEMQGSPLAAAVEDLSRAIEALEKASLRNASRADLSAELAVMRLDRNKLAEALDAALARVKALEAARVTSGEKLDSAITAIRGVLAREGQR